MSKKILQIAAAALLTCTGVANADAQTKKPNIIFIMADDLGIGEIGPYGNTFNETPNLDRLAKQSLKFTQAYAAAPICSPTRASLMTGQYPARVHITDFLPGKSDRFLDPAKYITINEALGTAGYRTAICGKWHLDVDFKNPKGSPQQHGFNEVIGSETKYIADGDYFYPYDKIATFNTGTEGEYLTDRQAKEASDFIVRNKSNPFYLYLTFYAIHTKLDAPEDLVNKYKVKFDTKYGKGLAHKLYGPDNVRKENAHKDNPYLAAMVERVDAGVGLIMKTLEEQGLADNTILVFFSDNGGAGKQANNSIYRAGKSWLYEGGIREPLIIRWPGHVKANAVTNEPVCSIDIYPTFLDAAGVKNPAGNIVDGKSIFQLMTEGKPVNRDAIFWHYPSETGGWKPRMASAVHAGNYKLLEFYIDHHLELYDLKKDPSEEKDLSKSMPEKTAELKKMLDDWRAEVKAEEPNMDARPGGE